MENNQGIYWKGSGKGSRNNASRHRSLHHDSHTFPIVIQSEDI